MLEEEEKQKDSETNENYWNVLREKNLSLSVRRENLTGILQTAAIEKIDQLNTPPPDISFHLLFHHSFPSNLNEFRLISYIHFFEQQLVWTRTLTDNFLFLASEKGVGQQSTLGLYTVRIGSNEGSKEDSKDCLKCNK